MSANKTGKERARRVAVGGYAWLRWHPLLTGSAVVVLAVAVMGGWAGLLTLGVVSGAIAGVWWQGQRSSFERHVLDRLRSSWRREMTYRRAWRQAMFLAGLACRFDGKEIVPQLGRVRSSWSSDVVAVKLVTAQESIDWERQSGALAQTYGALECNLRGSRQHWIELEFVFRRDLPVVPPLPIPDVPDLESVVIGRRGDGKPWFLRIAETHVLIVGATGAGKAGVMWSIIRALAGGVRKGVVAIWACDPKGGMEFGHGVNDPDSGEPTCPLFERFARTPDAIADLLDAAVDLMRERAKRLSGVARHHEATPDDPTVVITIDELADLATYGSERVRERVRRSMGLLLSQGRALGVHLVAATQSPDQIKPEVRRAYPTRICLRTVDADQVDMVLGRGAWARGAKCERISETAPGCAWVILDGEREPTWVRSSYPDDSDIAEMGRDYAAPSKRPAPAESPQPVRLAQPAQVIALGPVRDAKATEPEPVEAGSRGA